MFILSGALVFLGLRVSSKALNDREIKRPFECGFSPKSKPRLPLSLRFYLIAIVFLVFDVELVLMFPIIVGRGLEELVRALGLGVFSVILLAGLYYELNQGRLSWAS